MYHLGDYLWMLADTARVDAYAAAIRAVVRAGDRVLEVGAGFGFFAVLAAKAGAAHVDAVESNQVAHLGARVAADNGVAHRIAFHVLDARDLRLPERADVLLADLRGPTPFCGTALATLIDARDRLLKPGGAVIAARDTVYVAPCATPATVAREADAAHGGHGVELRAIDRVIADTPIRCHIEREALRGAGCPWAVVDYASIADPNASGSAEWRMTGQAAIRGLAVWFESDLAPGVHLSTAPPQGVTYGQMFVPFSAPIGAHAEDTLRISIGARLVGGDYVWSWRAWVNGALVRDQNSLAERVIDPSLLAARSRPGGV